jgi:hypothetical protein
MTAGAVDVALILSPSVLGPNGDFAYDKEFAIPAAANYGEVMASAPHPNAAQIFANWLVGASVGKVFDSHSLVPAMPIQGGKVTAKDIQPFEVPPPDQAKRSKADQCRLGSVAAGSASNVRHRHRRPEHKYGRTGLSFAVTLVRHRVQAGFWFLQPMHGAKAGRRGPLASEANPLQCHRPCAPPR